MANVVLLVWSHLRAETTDQRGDACGDVRGFGERVADVERINREAAATLDEANVLGAGEVEEAFAVLGLFFVVGIRRFEFAFEIKKEKADALSGELGEKVADDFGVSGGVVAATATRNGAKSSVLMIACRARSGFGVRAPSTPPLRGLRASVSKSK